MSSKLIVDTIEDATGTYSLALGSGNSTFPGGIHIGGTGSANLLDDYEEGTWTPTFLGSTTNPTVTYHSSTIGTYQKIGNFVTIFVQIRASTVSGGSGNLRIGGIPFTGHQDTDETNGQIALMLNVTNQTGYGCLQNDAGQSYLLVKKNNTNSDHSVSDLNTNTYIRGVVHYKVA